MFLSTKPVSLRQGSRLSFHSRGLPVCLELVCLLVGMIKFLPCAMRDDLIFRGLFRPGTVLPVLKIHPSLPARAHHGEVLLRSYFSVTQNLILCKTFIGDGESICILMHIDKALLMLGIARIFPCICRYVRAFCHLKYRICVMEICM